MKRIDKKIVGASVGSEQQPEIPETLGPMARPEVMEGRTYKLSNPALDSNLYVTVNELQKPDGTWVPFEVFFNTKDVGSQQWIIALSLVITSVFRTGGDVDFLAKELAGVYDPKGGYYKDGKFVPSLVADIASVLREHFAYLKRKGSVKVQEEEKQVNEGAPCHKCGEYSLKVLDGCETCTSCGYSKCG